MSAGFAENGIWKQLSDDAFFLLITILFWSQTFKRFPTSFIYQNTSILPVQQNVDETVTTWLMTSNTENSNLDNDKHDKSSNRGMVCDFSGTYRYPLGNKFTVSWTWMKVSYASPELSQNP